MTLLAAYNFDEASGSILDVTGNGHGFALSGDLVRVTGHTSTGLSRSVGPNSGPAAGPAVFGQSAARTVMAWVKKTAAGDGWLLEWNSSSIASGSWGLIYLSGQLQARGRNASGVQAAAITAPTADTTWRHIAGTYDGTNLRLYLNGALVATQALTSPMRTDANNLYLFDDLGSETVMDDIRVYDAALDAATITTLMGQPVAAAGAGVTLGLAIETDAAFGLVRSKALTLGRASETDTARSLVPAKQATLGVTTETDSTQRIVATKTVVLGVATETDAVFALLGAKQVTLGSAAETDTAHEITTGAAPGFTFGTAAETDTAQPLAASKAATLGQASETDTTLPLTLFKTVILGVATEPDSAAALTVAKVRTLGIAAETDAAYRLVFGSMGPATQSVLTASNAPSSALTPYPRPVLTPSNAPSSQLEVSHGV